MSVFNVEHHIQTACCATGSAELVACAECQNRVVRLEAREDIHESMFCALLLHRRGLATEIACVMSSSSHELLRGRLMLALSSPAPDRRSQLTPFEHVSAVISRSCFVGSLFLFRRLASTKTRTEPQTISQRKTRASLVSRLFEPIAGCAKKDTATRSSHANPLTQRVQPDRRQRRRAQQRRWRYLKGVSCSHSPPSGSCDEWCQQHLFFG